MKKYFLLLSLILFFPAILEFTTLKPIIEEYHYIPIFKEIKAEYATYPDIELILKRANIKLPRTPNLVYQGITFINDFILLTAYSADNTNSYCFILNQDGTIKNYVILPDNSHVGGIAYDAKNNIIWLPLKNGLASFDANDFLINKNPKPLKIFRNVAINLPNYQKPTENEIAYLTVYQNKLYLGSFTPKNNANLKEYEINYDNELKLIYKNQYEVPSIVQSISFYECKNTTYTIFSRSYKRNKPSLIEIYIHNEKINSFTLPPMLEQLTIKENELYGIYESGALKYHDGPTKNTEIWVFDLTKMLPYCAS